MRGFATSCSSYDSIGLLNAVHKAVKIMRLHQVHASDVVVLAFDVVVLAFDLSRLYYLYCPDPPKLAVAERFILYSLSNL